MFRCAVRFFSWLLHRNTDSDKITANEHNSETQKHAQPGGNKDKSTNSLKSESNGRKNETEDKQGESTNVAKRKGKSAVN